MKFLVYRSTAKWLLSVTVVFFLITSCQKDVKTFSNETQDEFPSRSNTKDNGHLKQTKTFSSDVVIRWLTQQLEMLRVPLAPGTGSQGADRAMAYCGIAAYESVVPGMPAYQSLSVQLSNFPEMPSTEPGKAYHWAASANAALAEMNRRLFPTTSAANKTSIDNLENTLKATYANEVDAATLQRSIAFGKEVATKVFAWTAVDGSANVNPPYGPPLQPVGPAFWISTPQILLLQQIHTQANDV